MDFHGDLSQATTVTLVLTSVRVKIVEIVEAKMHIHVCHFLGHQELIQNAEDAGAREVKFLYDHHSYGQDGRYLHHPGMSKYQVSQGDQCEFGGRIASWGRGSWCKYSGRMLSNYGSHVSYSG